MNGDSIQARLLKTCTSYCTPIVCALDQLPKTTRHSNTALVVNTDSAQLPGTHWLAIVGSSKGTAILFDSLGITPTPSVILFWLHRNYRHHFIVPATIVQYPFSRTCGLYCIYFVEQLLVHQIPLATLLHHFDYVNLKKNEKLVIDYYRNGS